MSKSKNKYKVIIIDVLEDKILENISCDAIIAGYAQKPDDERSMCGSVTLSCGDIGVTGGAIDAAEKAASRAEEKIIKSFLKNVEKEFAEDLLEKMEGEE
jgi:hypothetical protein